MNQVAIRITYNKTDKLFKVWFAYRALYWKLLGTFTTGEDAVLFADECRAPL